MRNYLLAVVFLLVWNSLVFAQQPSKPVIAEVKHRAAAVAAPQECLVAFREFFRYRLLEDGAWKLDDVYTFRGKFAQAESLNQYFREK